ncbi:MAG: hypothetical protein ACOWWR_02055 [Eubacteriales bacterium]
MIKDASEALLPIIVETIENFYPEHQKEYPVHTLEFLNARDFQKIY